MINNMENTCVCFYVYLGLNYIFIGLYYKYYCKKFNKYKEECKEDIIKNKMDEKATTF